MRMNRRGQALVEFVLILPVFIMILFSIIDFGNILFSKNQLESTSSDIVRLVYQKKNVQEVLPEYKGVSVHLENYKDDYVKVVVSQDIKVITPFLGRFLGDPCHIEVERVIPNA